MSVMEYEKNILHNGIFVTQINDMYKVSLVPRACLDGVPNATERNKDNAKTKEALCRARNTVIELAYCNEWDFFFTATFDKEKVTDRTSRDATIKKMVKWFQNQSRNYDIKYLILPELHKDNVSLHAHGLVKFGTRPSLTPFDSIKDRVIPKRLLGKGYLNWDDYEKKFGFCSLGEVKNHKAVSFYVTKYITKNMRLAIEDFNAHTYFASKGLKRGFKVGGFHSRHAVDVHLKMQWDYIDKEFGYASKMIHSAEELQAFLGKYGFELEHAKTEKKPPSICQNIL